MKDKNFLLKMCFALMAVEIIKHKETITPDAANKIESILIEFAKSYSRCS